VSRRSPPNSSRLGDFKPVGGGRVEVVLSGGGPEERFECAAPTVPGIFRPVAGPGIPGRIAAQVREAMAGVAGVADLSIEQQSDIPFLT
jgi:hypothetical protein